MWYPLTLNSRDIGITDILEYPSHWSICPPFIIVLLFLFIYLFFIIVFVAIIQIIIFHSSSVLFDIEHVSFSNHNLVFFNLLYFWIVDLLTTVNLIFKYLSNSGFYY